MPRYWSILWIILLYSFSAGAASSSRQFALSVNQELSNDENFYVEVLTPPEEKIFALRSKLVALDDSEFKDQIKSTKIIRDNKNSTHFLIKRQFLNRGHYVLETEIDYKKVRLFNWLNFFEPANTMKVYLKIEVEKAPGD